MVDKKESIVQFSERLKSIVPSGSGREFAKRAGIGYSTVHNYLQAVSSPTLENLVLLAKAGNVSVEWLATGKEFRGDVLTPVHEIESGRVCKIPFYERNEFLYLDIKGFSDLQASAQHLIALYVDTDVMEPTLGIGAVIIVDSSISQLKENQLIVLSRGNSYLFKRVQVVSDGYNLLSDNKKYPALSVKDNELSSFYFLGEIKLVVNKI